MKNSFLIFILLFTLNKFSSSQISEHKLLPSDGSANDHFGTSVAISDDFSIVGVPGDDDLGDASGSVYAFIRDGSNWYETQKITASDGKAGDNFGTCALIFGDNFIVGASGDDDNGPRSGSAYFFRRDVTTGFRNKNL